MKVNGWLPDVEMEELKREVNNEGGAIQDTSRPTHMSGEITTANEREQEGGHSTSWEVEQLTDEEKGRMQIWRTTRSAPGTSCMKVRLVRPRCFVLTIFPRKILLRGRSSLFYFAMPTSFLVPECH